MTYENEICQNQIYLIFRIYFVQQTNMNVQKPKKHKKRATDEAL